jgi:putative FmdB family regulatory protein
MPTYCYECDRCGARSEEQRSIAERRRMDGCPKCERGYLLSVPATPATINPGADTWRTVMKDR